MKKSVSLCALLALPLILTGCGDSPEKLAKDWTSEFDNVAAIISSVNDEASAKAAVEKLKAFKPRLDALIERAKKFEGEKVQPPKEAQEAMFKSMGTVMAKMAELEDKNPKAAKILDDGWNMIESSMKKPR